MKITEDMVIELNNELKDMGCSFRYNYNEQGFSGNSQINITLPSMNYVDSFIINPSREFFNWLKLWFKLKGIEIACNNDGSIIWSLTGYDSDN